ncbi:MAG: class I SAM-dependent methyltransferase [Promethearchaeota archaeon]
MNLQTIIDTFPANRQRDIPFLFDLVQKLNIPQDSKILDVGTGRGIMSIVLAAQGYNVITGEPANAHWGDWKTPVNKLDLTDKIKFVPFEVENMLFDDNGFDGIFLFATFHHLQQKSEAITRLLKLVKRSGILCIIEFTEKAILKLKVLHPDHPDMVDPRDFLDDRDVNVELINSDFLNAFIFHEK